MTGYLMRLAVRSTRTTGGLRPRAPSLFEAPPPAMEVAAPTAGKPGAATTSATPPTVPPARPSERPVASRLPVDAPRAIAGEPDLSSPPPPAAEAPEPDQPAAAAVRPASPADTGDRPPEVDLPAAVVSTRHDEALTAPRRADAVPEGRRPAPPTNDAEVRAPSAPRAAPADPPTYDVVLPRLHPGPAPAPPAPEVRVSIGRIEVVAAPPAAPGPATPPTPTPETPPARSTPRRRATSAPALADYLRERSRR
jgi:hypothetical protein